MTFSIIIPVYNGEKFIASSVKSALSQDYSGDYEIIIVENGSSDNTPALCDEYAAKYDRVRVIHEGKIGLYMARQTGILSAAGDYIVALDSDDCLSKDALSSIYDCISFFTDKAKAPDLIFYNAKNMGEERGLIGPTSFDSQVLYSGEEKKALKDLICAGDSINAMWIKAIRKEIAAIEIRQKGLNYGEDLFQTAIYIDRADTIAFINKALYSYRDNSDSLTATYNKAFMENQKFVWQKIDELSLKWGDPAYKSQIAQRKALTCSIVVAKLIYSNLDITEKKSILKELMEDPFYQRYARVNLPEWAPEENVFVHGLIMEEGAYDALISNARKYGFKQKIKRLIGRGK